MSDLMRPIKFGDMMERVLEEYSKYNTVYSIENIHKNEKEERLNIFGLKLESPVGAAAGPNTQLAHNIVACYFAGMRFMELKTVQIMEGEELGIPKPCIRAEDEAYNVEWSTELDILVAADEYIKAYFACKVFAKEFELGDPEGFVFNMSVGYDLKGIKSPKVDKFIETLKDGSKSSMWQECEDYLLNNLDKFDKIDEKFIKSINKDFVNSITLSTMHGCPPEEIEQIASYLIEEKHLNTYIKLNPTLLGYDRAREILDSMGYDYIKFGKEGFDNDLKFDDALALIKRLREKADKLNLAFGVKLTNTFQVDIKQNELPGENMYMSGKSLYPLTINVAYELSKAFDGDLPISFSGGADKNNIKEIFEAGIYPITVATVLLKPKGLDNGASLAKLVEECEYPQAQHTDTQKLKELCDKVLEDKKYQKSEAQKKKYAKKDYHGAKDDDHRCRVLCQSCVRVCPNRCNEVVDLGDEKIIVHMDQICNECGNCQFFCVEPCRPFKDRFTIFENEEAFNDSENDGYTKVDERYLFRFQNQTDTLKKEELPEEVKKIIEAIENTKAYLTK
ncbi:MAG: selenate reductase [Tissierellia bacterium]|nr:selenate reductase [Tissierellia bacterium]